MKYYSVNSMSRIKLTTLIIGCLLSLFVSLNTTAQDQLYYQVYNAQYDSDLENDRAVIMALLNSKLNSIISSGSCESDIQQSFIQQIEGYVVAISTVNDIAQNDANFMAKNNGLEPEFNVEEFEDVLYDQSLVPGQYLSLYSSLNNNYEQTLNEWLVNFDNCETIMDIASSGAVIGIGRAKVGNNQFYLTLIISEAWQIVKPGQTFTKTIKNTSSEDRQQFPVFKNILIAPIKPRILKFNMN